MRPIRGSLLIDFAAALALSAIAAVGLLAGTQPAPAATPAGKPLRVAAHYAYLGKNYADPPPLSLLDPIVDDEGLAGAVLGNRENVATGRLLGDGYTLDEVVVPADGDVGAAADALFSAASASSSPISPARISSPSRRARALATR